MGAIGAGIRTRRSEPQAVDPRHQRRLPAEPPVRVEHGLGGLPVEPEVKSTTATSEGRVRRSSGGDGLVAHLVVAERGRVPKGPRRQPLESESRFDLGEGVAPDTADLNEWRNRRGHRPDAPTGPGEHRGGQAVGQACQATDSPLRDASGSVDHRPPPGPPGRPGWRRRRAWSSPSTTSPPRAEIRASSVGTSHGPRGRRYVRA